MQSNDVQVVSINTFSHHLGAGLWTSIYSISIFCLVKIMSGFSHLYTCLFGRICFSYHTRIVKLPYMSGVW